MKVATNLRYAIRMIVLLAEKDQLVNTNKLASSLNVSPLYLRQIALKLKKANLIKSTKGAKGGYILLKKPENITIHLIATIMKSEYVPHCIFKDLHCSTIKNCKTKKFWVKLKKTIENVFNSVTIKDIIEKDVL